MSSTPLFLSFFFGVLVFALTMAGAHDTVDARLLEVKGQVDGIADDIRTMHERLDSTVTSTTERFNQLDLAQTATRTTLDTILARLDVLTTKMEQDYGSDTEQDDGDRRGRARHVVRQALLDGVVQMQQVAHAEGLLHYTKRNIFMHFILPYFIILIIILQFAIKRNARAIRVASG